jgi:hypothetical protein
MSDEFTSRKYRKPEQQSPLRDDELVALNEELERFRMKRYNKFFDRETSFIDQRAWLKSRGAFSANGSVVIEGYEPAEYNEQGKVTKHMDCHPLRYEQCMWEWDSWIAWKGRKEFARKKEAEELDSMAQQNSEIQSARTALAGDMHNAGGKLEAPPELTYPYAND